MSSDSPSPISLAISNDGISWTTVGNVVELTNARHSIVLYDPNSFGEGNGFYYKIWYWNSAFSTSIASLELLDLLMESIGCKIANVLKTLHFH